ncbi:MAG: hypothetical protein M1813_005988 [Trichoglossum hirsutum]|nr:MAG: hypothetical protein M1813_005988 [Trichoglossum hirsutum]
MADELTALLKAHSLDPVLGKMALHCLLIGDHDEHSCKGQRPAIFTLDSQILAFMQIVCE